MVVKTLLLAFRPGSPAADIQPAVPRPERGLFNEAVNRWQPARPGVKSITASPAQAPKRHDPASELSWGPSVLGVLQSFTARARSLTKADGGFEAGRLQEG